MAAVEWLALRAAWQYVGMVQSPLSIIAILHIHVNVVDLSLP